MSLGFVAAVREGEEAARRYVERALEIEERMWFIGIEGRAWPLATAALARGDGATAIELLAGTDLELCQANYAPMTMGADLVEAHARSGDAGTAREVLAELEPHAHQRWARAALDRARGIVADDHRFDAPLEGRRRHSTNWACASREHAAACASARGCGALAAVSKLASSSARRS